MYGSSSSGNRENSQPAGSGIAAPARTGKARSRSR
jgi:hypothetical protein